MTHHKLTFTIKNNHVQKPFAFFLFLLFEIVMLTVEIGLL